MSEPLRFGLLGASRIAVEALVDPARETGDRLVAVAARSRDRAEAFAARHGVERVHEDYPALIEDPDVDVVYNPLANSLHGPWNLAAIAAGKTVFGEKPFAGDGAEAREVRDAAAAAGVPVVVGYHYVHHPLTWRLHAVVGSGEIGDVTAVETRMRMPAPPDADPRWSLELAGGALMDLGCYAVHSLLMAAPFAGGTPTLAEARAGERPGRPGVDEWADAEFRYPGGASGRVHTHMAADGWEFQHRIVGTRGSVTAPMFALPTRDDRLVVRVGDVERTERLGTRPTYTYQLEALRAHLRDGAPLHEGAGVDAAVTVAELVDEIYLASGLSPRPRHAVPAAP
jgi:predicted dehydrogenase